MSSKEVREMENERYYGNGKCASSSNISNSIMSQRQNLKNMSIMMQIFNINCKNTIQVQFEIT